MSNHISVAKYSSYLAKTEVSNIAITCSKMQFTFQISPFTKYGHHSSLMNYTTGISENIATCTHSQRHFCHGL